MLAALDQLAHWNTEKLAIRDVFIRPMGPVCQHHLTPAIRQGDTGLENPLEAAQRIWVDPLQKRLCCQGRNCKQQPTGPVRLIPTRTTIYARDNVHPKATS
jgi:hypothetical protein